MATATQRAKIDPCSHSFALYFAKCQKSQIHQTNEQAHVAAKPGLDAIHDRLRDSTVHLFDQRKPNYPQKLIFFVFLPGSVIAVKPHMIL